MIPEETLKKIQGFHFRTRRMANELFAGQYVSAFKGRGIDREIALVPGLGTECIFCNECFAYCRGGKIIQEMDRVYDR